MADGSPRGRTTIADRVLETLAARYALGVPGVVRHSPGPDVLSSLTQTYPRVSADTDSGAVHVDIKLAVEWTAHAAAVAVAVRRTVRDQLRATTGQRVESVDVTVTALVPPGHQRSSEANRRVS